MVHTWSSYQVLNKKLGNLKKKKKKVNPCLYRSDPYAMQIIHNRLSDGKC